MDDFVFFDLNGVLGTPIFAPDTGTYTGYRPVETLLSDMDYYGVDYALVSHFRCLYGNPMPGNKHLIREIRGTPGAERLFPCWVLLPGSTGEVPTGENLARALGENDVKAVRLNFGAFNLPAGDWIIDDLLTTLEENGILTILQFPTLGVAVPEREDPYLVLLDRLLSRHPDLDIVTGGRLRGLYPLMDRHENLFLSMEWDSHPDLVEDVCRRFSSKRLLFATPNSENAREISGMPLLTITYAGISQTEKRRVAGLNLADLLGLDTERIPAIEELPGRQTFADLRAGRPVAYDVVDIHAHAGSWSWEYKPGTDLSDLLQVMDRIGVDQICINATEAILGGDHLSANAELAEELKQYRDRLIGFAVINPHFQDCAAYIERCIGELGFRGLKIHPRTHRCAVTDDRYQPVWAASEKYRIPVLCHTGQGQAFSEPDQFHKIAPRYPGGIFIIGHTGETFAGMQQCIDLANRYENIFLEISGWLFMNRRYLEFLVQRVDVERILFGSDYSWIDLRYALAIVLFAHLDERDKQLILSENSRRILGWGGLKS